MFPRRHRASKYGAVRATGTSGRSYASKAERDRADELRLMEQGGEISDLREQRIVLLAETVRYRCDFDYLERGRRVYEDVKGVETERFRVVCQLWRRFGPGPLRVIKRRGRLFGFVCVREILPKAGAGTEGRGEADGVRRRRAGKPTPAARDGA